MPAVAKRTTNVLVVAGKNSERYTIGMAEALAASPVRKGRKRYLITKEGVVINGVGAKAKIRFKKIKAAVHGV